MKFFTRELLNSLNDDNVTDEELDKYAEIWFQQLELYIKHIDELKPNVIPNIELCLHDFMFLNLSLKNNVLTLLFEENLNVINNGIAENIKNYYVLEYTLSDIFCIDDQLNSKSEWYYDEFHKNEKGFVHNILFNNCEINIPFLELKWNVKKS